MAPEVKQRYQQMAEEGRQNTTKIWLLTDKEITPLKVEPPVRPPLPPLQRLPLQPQPR